jgi:hypothetical protein
MVGVNLVGGLGNYMFQIATAYSLATDNNDTFIIDTKKNLTVHKSVLNYRNNIFKNFIFDQINSFFFI